MFFLSPHYLKYDCRKLRVIVVRSVTVPFTWLCVYSAYSLWHTLISERSSEQAKAFSCGFLFLSTMIEKVCALIDVSTLRYRLGLFENGQIK